MTRADILQHLRAGSLIRLWPHGRVGWIDGETDPRRNLDEDERTIVKRMIGAGELVPVAALGPAPAYRWAR